MQDGHLAHPSIQSITTVLLLWERGRQPWGGGAGPASRRVRPVRGPLLEAPNGDGPTAIEEWAELRGPLNYANGGAKRRRLDGD